MVRTYVRGLYHYIRKIVQKLTTVITILINTTCYFHNGYILTVKSMVSYSTSN